MRIGKKGKVKKARTTTTTATVAKSKQRGPRRSGVVRMKGAKMQTKQAGIKGTKREAKLAEKGSPDSKRPSALNAAANVLMKIGKPMSCRELIAAMAEQVLWTSPKGKTPHATLYSAILREIGAKGLASRFRKVERGQFKFVGKDA